MMRSLALCLALSTCALMAHMPHELQSKIAALKLKNVQVSYKEGAHAIGIIGINMIGQKAAFVSLQYLAGNFLKWSQFSPIPFKQENDTFGLIQQGQKVVVIQSSSARNHENASGHLVDYDPIMERMIIKPIDPSRLAEQIEQSSSLDLIE